MNSWMASTICPHYNSWRDPVSIYFYSSAQNPLVAVGCGQNRSQEPPPFGSCHLPGSLYFICPIFSGLLAVPGHTRNAPVLGLCAHPSPPSSSLFCWHLLRDAHWMSFTLLLVLLSLTFTLLCVLFPSLFALFFNDLFSTAEM